MKNILVLCLGLFICFGLALYGLQTPEVSADHKVQATTSATPKQTQGQAEAAVSNVQLKAVPPERILVAFYSRTGDNYAVGNITKGNTHIVADMLARDLGAKTFEIKTVKQYPANYRETTNEAQEEKRNKARPAMATKVENMQDYDVIFLGYPIWWSDMPMVIYNFMESYDFQGKTIIPFATSAGNVMTGKESTIPEYAKGATVLKGLGVAGKRAQQNPSSVESEVKNWLIKLGFTVKE